MRRGLSCFLISIGFLLVRAQDNTGAGIQALLDSASQTWYLDFDKTERLLNHAEQRIRELGEEKHITDLIEVYKLRISSCNAFSRLQLWRVYTLEVERLLTQYKATLGDPFYQLKLENEIAQAQNYFTMGDYASALERFSMLREELSKLPESPEICGRLMVICNYIAGIHKANGEYEASINQHQASIQYYDCTGNASKQYPALAYRNIASVCFAKGDLAQTSRYLKLAEALLQDLLKSSPLSTSRMALALYETQASYYKSVGKLDSAHKSMQKTIPLLALEGVTEEFKGRINFSLGDLYLSEGKLSEAGKYYDLADQYFLKSSEQQASHLSGVYLSKSSLYEKARNPNKALEYCQKAMEVLVIDFNPDSDENPSLLGMISKKRLFAALQKKSRLLEKVGAQKQNIQTLMKAYRTNRLALALIDSTANEYSLDQDKIILQEQTFGAFEDGIRMATRLYRETGHEKYFEDVFQMVDKSKAVLLLENLRLVNRFSGINEEWLIRERELKSELLEVEKKLYESELRMDQENIKTNRERFTSLRHDYASLVERIRREAPSYYRLRFDRSIVSPAVVQKELLADGEALIEYFVGDSTITIVALSNKVRHLKTIKPEQDIAQQISDLRRLMLAVDDIKPDNEFLQLSHNLYNLLLKDCIETLGKGITRLTVVPDGVLGYVPFEVLISSLGERPHYVFENVAIRYAQSASYVYELSRKDVLKPKSFFAGFVAGENVNRYAQLPGARREVNAITELVKRNFSIFDPADKQSFLERARDYRVLHLAMHSSVNDQKPMMSELVFAGDSLDALSENLLTAIELYSMTLSAEMVVLSACETGVGQLHRGEGIMSFSRAFAYAGASSAVISLWRVPDKATSLIMVLFYKHLKEGSTKDKALQLAKKDFVEQYPQMAHPFYWAGFILSGKNDPIEFPAATAWWVYVIGLSVLVAVLLAGKKAIAIMRTS
jgi:CHAT domain-containing protein